MSDLSQNKPIDLDLVDKVYSLIPETTWSHVIKSMVVHLVDAMPGKVLYRLTGSVEDFDKAEEILNLFYEPQEKYKELIIDCFKIFGAEDTLYFLEALKLDEYAKSLDVAITDSAPCSIDL